MKKPVKPKLGRPLAYQEDLDFINIECAKKKMSQPEFVGMVLAHYNTLSETTQIKIRDGYRLLKERQ